MAWGYGLKTRKEDGRGIVVDHIDAGEYLLVKGVDFGARGARKLTVSVQAPSGAGMEVHLDSPDGPLAGTLSVKAAAGWKQVSCRLSGAQGVHDLYFVFTQGGFDWDWWQMK